jgi:hypothetical protein
MPTHELIAAYYPRYRRTTFYRMGLSIDFLNIKIAKNCSIAITIGPANVPPVVLKNAD